MCEIGTTQRLIYEIINNLLILFLFMSERAISGVVRILGADHPAMTRFGPRINGGFQWHGGADLFQ